MTPASDVVGYVHATLRDLAPFPWGTSVGTDDLAAAAAALAEVGARVLEALDAREVEGLAEGAGLEPAGAHGCQVAPQAEEVAFRTRNFPVRLASLVRGAAGAVRALEALPGAARRRGRFQFRLYRKP